MQYPISRIILTKWVLAVRTITATTVILLILGEPLHADSGTNGNSSQSPRTITSEYEALFAPTSQKFRSSDLMGKAGDLEKIGYDLARLYTEYQAYITTEGSPTDFETNVPLLPLVYTRKEAYVVIDAIASKDARELLAALEELGLENGESFGAVVSGEMPIFALSDMAELSTMRFARPAIAVTDVGVVTSQADKALATDTVRNQFGVDGTGIKVGVISDSYNCLGGAAKDVASGDAPPDVINMAEESKCAKGKDEGRAIVQLIHDIAPGAHQTFHTGFGGQAAFANAILRMADVAKVDVIVDDLRYLMEPMFQDGIIAQAVDQVVAAGIPYFASAGNNARQAYRSPFVSSVGKPPYGLPKDIPIEIFHDFAPGATVDPLQKITIPVGTTAVFNLQWDQPYASATGGAGSASDLDMILLDAASNFPVSLAIDNNLGKDPIEILRFVNRGPGTTFNLAIVRISGPKPTNMRYIYTGTDITIDEYDTNSSTLYGHANANGAQAVGAAHYLYTPAYFTTPPLLEPFSSAGSMPILFDLKDAPTLEIRKKPDIVAPDGVNNTFFGTDIDDQWDGSDRDLFPNFFGTSAAAPNAAAVAALMLAANPTLSPNQLYSALQSSAIDMGEEGFDDDTGYGLIQAVPALEMAVQHDVINTQTSVQATALPGQRLDYVINITNQGPNPTIRVTITNTPPANLLDIVTVASVASTNTDSAPSNIASNSGNPIHNLAVGDRRVMTVTGRIDPTLNTDLNLINETLLTSLGDNQPNNNTSRVSVIVRVPRIQFDNKDTDGHLTAEDAIDGGVNSNNIYTITLDQANPFADVTVHYATDSNKIGTGYIPITGVLTIPPGELSITVTAPAITGELAVGETITMHLSEPKGTMLGGLTTLILATNPDSDGDGLADKDDQQPQDPCIPNQFVELCDQEPDGLTNAEEALHKTDPTKPDSDGDGLNDGDEVKNGSNPLDACEPTRKAAACVPDTGGSDDGDNDDQDKDGITDENDSDPHDPCMPNPNNSACHTNNPNPPNGNPGELYLPAIRGKTAP